MKAAESESGLRYQESSRLLVRRTLQVTAVRIAQIPAFALRCDTVLILLGRRGSGKLQLRMFFQAKLVLQDAAGNTGRILGKSDGHKGDGTSNERDQRGNAQKQFHGSNNGE